MNSKPRTGRPSRMTEATLQKLEHGFLQGLTDKEACLYAGICPSTLYNYCQLHPEFMERKELLKEQPIITAKFVVVRAIDAGDIKAAQWYLERKAKDEFSTRQQADFRSFEAVQIIDDLNKCNT